jgi:Skp family chaperone for outer membrane proteins
MKSLTWLVLTFSLLLAAGGCAKQAGEAQRIGVVDIGRVFQESQAGKQGMAYLQSINEEFRKEFEKLQTAPGENGNAQKLQQAIAEYQAKIGQEQERVVNLLNEEFRDVLEDFRKQNNYTVLLSQENVLSLSDGVNVTEQVIREFDKVQIDLAAGAPKQEPKAEEAPAPEDQNATRPAPQEGGGQNATAQ